MAMDDGYQFWYLPPSAARIPGLAEREAMSKAVAARHLDLKPILLILHN